MQILSFSPFGYEGNLVNVEVDLRRGIPAIDIVGLADGAVKESRERMKSAILNSGLTFPPERVLISLSPADLKKEGAAFDLAVALAVLSAKERLDSEEFPTGDDFASDEGDASYGKSGSDAQDAIYSVLVMGELELNGNVRPVKAVHAAVSTAYASGIRRCIVPAENADEAREIRSMKVFGSSNLTEAFEALKNPLSFSAYDEVNNQSDDEKPEDAVDVEGVFFPKVEHEFADVYGQAKLVRALQIAAAGNHNLLAFGPPGCGKTLSLQRFPSLLPLLTKEESQSVTRIYSIAGLLQPGSKGVRRAPFRQPHQTATIEGMCGGGPKYIPGEISLAHNGALFLDEAAEFKTSVLQMLRVPLETGSVSLSRAGRTTVFPADFQLLMSMNPCPCGNYGSREKLCLCSARAVEQYWKKISAPLLDRIDLRVQVDKKGTREEDDEPSVSTEELRVAVSRATKAQRKRGKKNSKLTPSEVKDYCTMTSDAKRLLDDASEREEFSPRAVSSCMKVARTIADMQEEDIITAEAISEAVSFRKAEGAMELLG